MRLYSVNVNNMGILFPSSDLYSLAVTAVVMLTGIDPQMLNSQASGQDQWRSKASISNDLGRILDRMLEAAPAKRYQSAAAVLADLEQLTRATLKCPITKVSAPPSIAIKQQPTMIDRGVVGSNHLNSNLPIASNLTATFITNCEQELTKYIGPIARMLVNKTLIKYPNLTPAELIELLVQQIPQPLAAAEFSQRCRS